MKKFALPTDICTQCGEASHGGFNIGVGSLASDSAGSVSQCGTDEQSVRRRFGDGCGNRSAQRLRGDFNLHFFVLETFLKKGFQAFQKLFLKAKLRGNFARDNTEKQNCEAISRG
jgi:hypothetical protein